MTSNNRKRPLVDQTGNHRCKVHKVSTECQENCNTTKSQANYTTKVDVNDSETLVFYRPRDPHTKRHLSRTSSSSSSSNNFQDSQVKLISILRLDLRCFTCWQCFPSVRMIQWFSLRRFPRKRQPVIHQTLYRGPNAAQPKMKTGTNQIFCVINSICLAQALVVMMDLVYWTHRLLMAAKSHTSKSARIRAEHHLNWVSPSP